MMQQQKKGEMCHSCCYETYNYSSLAQADVHCESSGPRSQWHLLVSLVASSCRWGWLQACNTWELSMGMVRDKEQVLKTFQLVEESHGVEINVQWIHSQNQRYTNDAVDNGIHSSPQCTCTEYHLLSFPHRTMLWYLCKTNFLHKNTHISCLIQQRNYPLERWWNLYFRNPNRNTVPL